MIFTNTLTKKLVCLLIFTFNSFLGFSQTTPTWKNNFPKIIHGAKTIDIAVKTNNATKVYYAVYKNDQNILSPSSVKTAALSIGNGNLQKNGTLTILGDSAFVNLTGFTDNSTFYVYLTAENGTILSSNSFKQTIILPKKQLELSYTSNPALGDGNLHGYLLYYPEEYYKNPTKNYPLMIVLHGIGERGTLNYGNLKRHGPAKLVDGGRDFPFIIATPQTYIYAGSWSKLVVNEFLDKMILENRVEVSKIYMTGFSMGGAGTLSYAAGYPNKVSAVVPISGWSSGGMCNLTNVPVWGFHNNNDGTVQAIGTINAINNINACQPPPVVTAIQTIYPNGGHDAWTKTYNGSAGHDIYTWMLQYSKSFNSNPGVLPIVSAGANKTLTLPTNSTTLFGSATDPNGIIVTYSWTKISGPSATMGAQNIASLQISNLQIGSYVFRLTVTDNSGDTSFSNVTITVVPEPNVAPIANAGLDKTLIGLQNSVNIIGIGTDSDGTIVSYSWKKLSGPSTITLGALNTSTLSLSNIGVGTYVFRLTVTDNDGEVDFDDVSIIRSSTGSVNSAPTANAGTDKNITLPTNSITLAGSAIDTDGNIVSYLWNKQSGGTAIITNSTSSSVVLSSLQAGVYVFRLTVTDDDGASDNDEVTVTVNSAGPNQSPTVSILQPTNNFTLLVGNFLAVSISASDPDGSVSLVELYDGTTKIADDNSSPFSFSINTLTVGNHNLTAKAKDNLNAVATSSIINVSVVAGANCGSTGYILREQWNNNLGNSLTTSVFSTLISSNSQLTQTETAQNTGDNFSDRLRGYVCAPMSGNYIFYISGDDYCEVYLSTNSSSFNKTKIAQVYGHTNYRDYNKYSSQQSIPISLVAGQKYYIEIIHKEGTGQDNVSVGWKLPDGNFERPIAGNRLSPYVNQLPDVDAGNDLMEIEGVSSIVLNGSATDSDGAVISYLWSKISGPNVTLSVLNSNDLTLSNPIIGNYLFRLTVKDNSGFTNTDDVIVSVIDQNVAPIVSAGTNRYIFANASSITLSGSAIDNDGSIVSQFWTFVSGPSLPTLINATTKKLKVQNLIAGTYTFNFTAVDNDNDSTSDGVSVFVSAPASAKLFRINAGGSTALDNPFDWEQDVQSNPNQFLNPANLGMVTGTSTWSNLNKTGAPNQIFKTYRFHTSSTVPLKYEFPVNNGDFEVKLFFAENNASVLAGNTIREFDIFLEEKKYVDNLNVEAEAGADAMVKTFYLTIADNILDIEFVKQISNPIISGIEISELIKSTPGKKESIGQNSFATSNIKIYPNPILNDFTIELPNGMTGDLVLSDVLGRIMSRQKLNSEFNNVTMDALQFPKGIYLYQVTLNDNQIINGRILKTE